MSSTSGLVARLLRFNRKVRLVAIDSAASKQTGGAQPCFPATYGDRLLRLCS
jgi:hypothetical protein